MGTQLLLGNQPAANGTSQHLIPRQNPLFLGFFFKDTLCFSPTGTTFSLSHQFFYYHSLPFDVPHSLFIRWHLQKLLQFCSSRTLKPSTPSNKHDQHPPPSLQLFIKVLLFIERKNMVDFDYEELVKATESFSPKNLIGKGSHGMVYKGTLLNNNNNNNNNKLVAIKKSLLDPDNYSKLDNEICVLSSLNQSQNHNPHVIGLVGTSQHSNNNNNKLLVMEFMPNGSLHHLLHVASTPPLWPKRVEIAIQVARAVHFLHQGKPLVIHRDIKSENILFDPDWNAKLADFGLSVVLRVDSPSQVSQPAGTIGYLDPCYTTPSELSTKNDVFSFGVVLLEIISCRKVIDVCRSPASMVEWAVPLIQEQRIEEICDARIALPMYMASTIRHILYVAASCVSSNVACRPSFGDIVMEMENCFIERVRLPIWMNMLRSLILMRKRRNLTKRWQAKCATKKLGDVHGDVSGGKLLLWQVLADHAAME